MEKAVSLLVAKNETAQTLKFNNNGAVCIEHNDTGYHILWYITPEICPV